MASLNNGQPISHNNYAVKHVEHHIEVTSQADDSLVESISEELE